MRIDEIVTNGKGQAGSHGSWRVERDTDNDPFVGTYYTLWHYGAKMLRWRKSTRYGVEIVDYDIGHGSVSDQGGMNQAFRALGAPYYYSRKGGAEIVELCTCSRFTYSHRQDVGCIKELYVR